MSLRRICSLSVQSLKHLRKEKKRNSIPRKASKIVCDHKTQHNPTNRSREKRGAHAVEFVRSAAKRSSDSRASAPLKGRSENGLAYPLRQDSSLSSPQHTDLNKNLIPARQPAVAPCAKKHSPTQPKINLFLHRLARGSTTQINK
jgi:hypothetical protein